MMESIFGKIGVDGHQFRVLLVNAILLDLRGNWHANKNRRKLSPIVRSVLFYGLMGASLAFSFSSATSSYLYSLFMLTYSMSMMAFAVILEFGNSIINPVDWEVLSFRPVGSRTYFLAKIGNLFFYIFMIGMALCLLPSLAGLLVRGNRWFFPFVFFSVAMIANFLSVSFIVLMYTWFLRLMPYGKFKDILAYLQIALVFIIFFSYQLIPRMGRGIPLETIHSPGLKSYFFPPAWFAGMIQWVSGSRDASHVHLTLLAVFVTLFFALFSFRKISLDYAGLLSSIKTDSKSSIKAAPEKKLLNGLGVFQSIRFKHSETRSGFDLVRQMLKNDRSVKTTVYPLFGFPFAFLALEIIDGGLVDPFVSEAFSGNGAYSGISALFIFYMIFSFFTAVQYSRYWRASWIFKVAPIQSPGCFYRGVQWAVFFRLFVPFFIVLGFVYCLQMSFIHGIGHVLILFASSLFLVSIVVLFLESYPFSRQIRRGERIQRLTVLFFVLPLFVLIRLIQNWAYVNMTRWSLVLVGFVALFLFTNRLTLKRLDRKLGCIPEF